MCLPIAGAAAGTAAAVQSTTAIAGLVISAVGTAASMAASQQQAQMAQQQANLQLQQQRQQTEIQNQNLANQYTGEVAAQQAKRMAYERQVLNNTNAASRSFTQEQVKLNEARDKAAFKAQEIYAKSIGAKGSVLATGATGQSVGLLALDADRQAGLGTAAQDASIRSAEAQAGVAMDLASSQANSANNQAYSSLGVPVTMPNLAPSPGGGPINAPEYNWFD